MTSLNMEAGFMRYSVNRPSSNLSRVFQGTWQKFTEQAFFKTCLDGCPYRFQKLPREYIINNNSTQKN